MAKIICAKCGTECCTCKGCKSPDGKHCPTCYQLTQNANLSNQNLQQLPAAQPVNGKAG